jgi:DNA-binding NarL/FixJ family response regulator
MAESIRVMLVDDHQIILDSLALLFDLMEGIDLVASNNDSRKVVDILATTDVDVLITDMNMPYVSGIELSFLVKEKFPDIKILVLTVIDHGDRIHAAFKAGISGYVMKKADRKELETAIRTVASGQLHYSQEVMKSLLLSHDDEDHQEMLKHLTKREIEIIKLIVQEHSSSEIAEKLFISTGTVETHRHNIFKKLNVKNSIGLVKFALKYSLV